MKQLIGTVATALMTSLLTIVLSLFILSLNIMGSALDHPKIGYFVSTLAEM